MTTRRQWRKYARLAEQGRRLASRRDELIAHGVDPAELPVPLHPVPPAPIRGRRRAALDPLALAAAQLPIPGYRDADHLAQLSRAWAIVACACIAAFAGCGATTGAGLVVNEALTWHTIVTAIMAAMWAGGAVWAGIYSFRLGRRARTILGPPLRAVPDERKTGDVSP